MPDIGEYDSQTEWMSDCVPNAMSEGREQDQAVAMCLNMWRNRSATGGNTMNRPLRHKVEADDPELAPYGEVDYADPGLQDDGKARYPIDTEAHIRAAWNYIARSDNQKPYTSDQVRIIKKRIVAAWRKKIDEAGPPGLEEDEHLGKLFLTMTANQLVPAGRRGKPNGAGRRKQAAPAVEPDETHEDYMARCVNELGDEVEGESAADICQMAWDNSARAFRGGRRKASTPAVDPEETRAEYMSRCQSALSEGGTGGDEGEQICSLAWENSARSFNARHKQAPDVGEDETRDEYMGRCLSETDGDMEACVTAWEERGYRAGRRKQEEYDGYEMPSPGDDEDEDDFIDRCTANLEDEQDASEADADRLCALRWENRSAVSARPHRQPPRRHKEAPAVNEGEDRDEFMGRCLTETDGDMEACALAWDNRTEAKRMRHKTHAESVNGMTFILSDETPDRMGDIISSAGWDLANFRKNPIALFNHRSDFPIGRWENLRSEKGALQGELVLAPLGTSERIDEIRKLIEAGILKAVSVGFRPIRSEPRRVANKQVGEHFVRQELVETSLVSVPANPNALSIARSLDISEPTMNLVFAEHGAQRQVLRRSGGTSVAKHGGTSTVVNREEPRMGTLQNRIQATQQRINTLRDQLSDHLANVDDANPTESQVEAAAEMNRNMQQEQRQLALLVESEKMLTGVTPASEADQNRALVTRSPLAPTNGGGGVVAKPYITTNRSPAFPQRKEDRLELIVKAGVVNAFAHLRKLNIDAARMAIVNAGNPRYADDATRIFTQYTSRAEAAPAMTDVVGWAAELAQMTYADYMDLLYPKAVFPRLSAQGLSLSFGRAGRISIPMRAATPSIAGSFVGEGMPIPVRQAGFTSQILTPKKMAVITTWTREMDESSIPAIEGLLRNAIQEDTAGVLDNVLMDNVAASQIRPAGLLNGATILTAAAGGGFNALVEDMKALTGALLGPTAGNLRNLIFLMNPQQVLSASLTAMPGVSAFPFMDQLAGGRLLTYPVIESGSVPIGEVIALDAADFVTVGGESPRFEISDQATLHMEDDTPQPITNGGTAVPVRSLWQTDSLGLRLILPINWCMRRDGMVAAIQGVTW